MLPLTFPLLVLLSALSYVRAAASNVFVGCVLATELPLFAVQPQRLLNGGLCNQRCYANGYTYSYFISGLVAGGSNCYCDNEGSYLAASAYVLPAGGVLGSDTGCLPILQATATDLRTTFTFSNCVGTLTGVTVNLVDGTILGGALVDSPGACFDRCKGNLAAYFIPIVPSVTSILPSYGCVCDPSGEGSGLLCGVGAFYKYNHDASASGQARRRLQEAMNVDTPRRKSFCPGQMEACNVPGVSDAWECVDSTSDLESCGGCTHGDYTEQGFNSTSTGIDCTAIPGVRLGGSTCTNGRCEIFSCKRKWTLIDGQCVRL
ncbi:hypothetical protein I317_04046 [Kwoniella heveanensis CBS 569]|uniref:Protein CPL1-like domain-containing protein n=1 Tax=Kwoniella heveanensis BCC8398 TaxID=1296120 RepID=A0A1B9H3B8_9TREE|nr:hypothetical protein I316_00877 [Kwoniella heveanensis BCC8398]OCF42075.1 hypothetical protein I317_04046 [Kwoniella heveanensis CBS 569]